MIAVDTNILVYAHRRDSEWHAAAAACIERLAEGSVPWGIPWSCVHEFLAIVTHPRIYAPPSRLDQALRQVDAWLESPTANLLGETSDHWKNLKAALIAAKINGPAIHDARIATICTSHRVSELLTADREFGRFPTLRTRNPLVPQR